MLPLTCKAVFCRAISHSSRAQASRSHQSPEERQGPAFQSTLPCTSFFFEQTTWDGWPLSRVTLARRGGRKRRRAVTADFSSAVWEEFWGSLSCAGLATK